MLKAVGAPSLDALIDEVVPARIRLAKPLSLPPAESESTYLARLDSLARRNRVFRSYIGLGYYDTLTPSVILRCVFENPGWYTPYTPYQAEIAQGRLESLLNFQTMVADLTGMEVANASLLDEGTAAGEAMTLLHRVQAQEAWRSRRRVPRVGPRVPADARRAPQPRRTARHRAARGAGRCDGLRRPACSARWCSIPTKPGGCDDLRGFIAPRPRGGRAGGRCDRPAGARPLHAAGRDGRRRRARQLAALRRADGLRRSARGVLRHPAGPRAPDAGPHHRRLGGRAGAPGLPHGAADARAAHPPREGDLEHLHRAGAAGQHGRDVRGLSRAGRAAAIATRVHAMASALGTALVVARLRADERALLRHAAHPTDAAQATAIHAAAEARASTSDAPATPPSASRSTRPSPPPTSPTSSRCSPRRRGSRRAR